MKLNRKKFIQLVTLFPICAILLCSCDKNDTNNQQATLQLRLSDNPPPEIKEVWVDIQQVEILMEGGSPIMLEGVHTGMYNLLELTGGKDTLLADALIPSGTINQIRLILGDNNYIISSSGEKINLKTPSAQQSGLKLQLHQQVTGGILYQLTLDFDVARSIVFAGSSENVILKPVLRVISFVSSGGNLKGIVVPQSVITSVVAMQGIDTIASTFTNTMTGVYYIKDIPSGNYSIYFIPIDTTYQIMQKDTTVVLGQTTVVDSVYLHH